VGVALVVLIAVLVFAPGTLKVDAKGQLLPKKRRGVYAEHPGRVVEFMGNIKPGSYVRKDQNLVLMFDEKLGTDISQLSSEIEEQRKKLENAKAQELTAKRLQKTAELAQIIKDKGEAETQIQSRTNLLNSYRSRFNANLQKPGEFVVKAPLSGIVLTPDFRETWVNRQAKPNELILLIGQVPQVGQRIEDWEIELKIPQKHIGQILAAFPTNKNQAELDQAELDVDLLLLSKPTSTYKGKLRRDRISPQADPNKDDNNEPEPVVLAWVRIDGADIPEGSRLRKDLLLKGTEVHAKVRCGQHALGYTLFYGVWEFIYEKIVFFF
jgi:hypothetical protein